MVLASINVIRLAILVVLEIRIKRPLAVPAIALATAVRIALMAVIPIVRVLATISV